MKLIEMYMYKGFAFRPVLELDIPVEYKDVYKLAFNIYNQISLINSELPPASVESQLALYIDSYYGLIFLAQDEVDGEHNDMQSCAIYDCVSTAQKAYGAYVSNYFPRIQSKSEAKAIIDRIRKEEAKKEAEELRDKNLSEVRHIFQIGRDRGNYRRAFVLGDDLYCIVRKDSSILVDEESFRKLKDLLGDSARFIFIETGECVSMNSSGLYDVKPEDDERSMLHNDLRKIKNHGDFSRFIKSMDISQKPYRMILDKQILQYSDWLQKMERTDIRSQWVVHVGMDMSQKVSYLINSTLGRD